MLRCGGVVVEVGPPVCGDYTKNRYIAIIVVCVRTRVRAKRARKEARDTSILSRLVC